MYDLIGDIHGHAGELLALLDRLGYAHARILAARWMELSRQGLLIGDRDLQIAATAIVAQAALATLNIRAFQRVDGLALVDVTSYQT